MAIPIATTTISIFGKRPQSAIDPDAEGYDAPGPAPELLASGVRATITQPAGTRRYGDTDETVYYALRCDPVEADVTRFDTIIDEVSGVEYNVSHAQHSYPLAFGLNHITARLYFTRGLSAIGGETVVPA